MTTRPRLALVDYGAGNLVSVGRALEVAGAEIRAVSRGPDVDGFDGIVVPGVGASAPAMAVLRRTGLEPALREAVASGVPYLGICLGLQLVFERSDEDGAELLGLVPGVVRLLADAPRLPHIGWNAVERLREHPLFEGVKPDAPFYFVHSYAGEPRATEAALATTEHGSRFTSAVSVGRLVGVQFHPERSAEDGLRLLENYVGLVREPDRWTEVQGRRPADESAPGAVLSGAGR
ncbi:MAG TPA: imidazole glycerol phosphate synthase subunit HisH [Candidatus Limnocylindrales bacterium]|jgi:glutamine amidotransferase|nr:imidazole glycerol phosphate synthase subunit HisH [Candidatus Limnocylindrales bacterium]